MEAKRVVFPRFQFISNEDLIEILGESQKPQNIQKHLKKCFEGINKVKFRPNRGTDIALKREDITKLVSKEGEEIDLLKPIQPYKYEGKVEVWLQKLENHMKSSVKHVIAEGFRDFPEVGEGEDAADHLS